MPKTQMRLRTPTGQERLEIDDTEPLGALIRLVKEKTGLVDFSLKYGYPLKNLEMSLDAQEKPISDFNLRGETLVVVPTEAPPAPVAVEEKTQTFNPKGVEPDETSLEWPDRGGHLVLRVMPDDNSCMFTAVGGAVGVENPSQFLRHQVCEYILTHPDKYNKAILGEDPTRYTSKMMQMDTWGGAIELSILSEVYNIQICSIDVKSLRVDRFGEGKDTRIIIVYSGIHYDRIAFCLDLSYPVEVDVTKWGVEDEEVIEKARELAQRLQTMHYYTDTTDFVIKCEVCGWIGQGAKEAAQHERETSHGQFGEMAIH
ncbi:ubiquitin thioesterase OTU1 [Echria macrotheca]|uniref:Ubiquitin thioesterase OTU n=1 Tax=Echria macrotheca TaxID=438768 RepID=A0AAJ0B8N8_9PEZI|nr:ubiquitin thioesterase OTU1 [Echria macrotheca]